MNHDDLVKIAEKYLLKAKGCAFAFAELDALCGETPDAIGFRSGLSILIECKTSRSDFHADKKKHFRRNPQMGMGNVRYFMCPAGLIQPEDLPEKWGLIWVDEKGKARQKVGIKGNCYGSGSEFYFSEKCHSSETTMMSSALRRLQLRGVLGQVYWGVIGGEKDIAAGRCNQQLSGESS